MRKGGGRDGKPLAPRTVRRMHNIVRAALQQGVRWGWLATNPAVNATPPRTLKIEPRPPTLDDVATLLDFCERDDPDFAMFVRLAAATGARRGELLGVRWKAIDFDGRGCRARGAARRRFARAGRDRRWSVGSVHRASQGDLRVRVPCRRHGAREPKPTVATRCAGWCAAVRGRVVKRRVRDAERSRRVVHRSSRSSLSTSTRRRRDNPLVDIRPSW